MMNNAFSIAGKAKDVCAALEKEAERYKGITVDTWLRLCKIKAAVRKQFEEKEE